MEPAAPPQQPGPAPATEGVAKNGWAARLRWFLFLLLLIFGLFFTYALSLGPVMLHYRNHSPPTKPGIVGISLGKHLSGSTPNGMILLPRWVAGVYYPILSVPNKRTPLGKIFHNYLVWWLDGSSRCEENRRRLDEAKRTWATETKKPNGATPFATHIVEYLPGHRMPVCPNGGTYQFNEVGTGSTCSVHTEP